MVIVWYSMVIVWLYYGYIMVKIIKYFLTFLE
jgi:hypothetical protein